MPADSAGTLYPFIMIVIGALMVGPGLLLWMRRIPPNRLLGLRFLVFLPIEVDWYRLNSYYGRALALAGAIPMVMAPILVAAGTPRESGILVAAVVAVVGPFIGARIYGVHLASRLARKR